MKTLAQLEEDAKQENPKDFVCIFEFGPAQCSWLDPYLGIFEFKEIPGKAAYTGDFDRFKILGWEI